MNIKYCIIIFLAALYTHLAYGQTVNSKSICNDEIFVTAGVNVPMYKGLESDAVLGIHYGHSWYNGFGFRAGFQYSPSVANVGNAFGLPVALTWRSRSRSAAERLDGGLAGAYDAADYDPYGAHTSGGSVLSAFLVNLFDRIEFHAGVTPGYIAGASSDVSQESWGEGFRYYRDSWTEKPNSFSLTADAGFNLNFQVWRFDLKLMPAFHYNILNNYIFHTTTGDSVAGPSNSSTQPVRWFFTFSGGLAFHF